MVLPWAVMLMVTIVWTGESRAVVSNDEDGDGMGDFWEMFYGAEELLPDGDEDLDGATNLDESIAGTEWAAVRTVTMTTTKTC